MGYFYSQHRMIGEFISGDSERIYVFLAQNGYTFTEEEKEEIDNGGQLSWDILKKHNLQELEVICMDSWSGDDFFIGYDLGLKEETSPEAEELKESFKKLFPQSTPEFSSFTSVG